MKADDYAKAITTIIARELPWVEINWTLHGLLHQSAELIYLNGGWSLGALSEEALEANNKFVHHYLEQYSRTSPPYLQLTDTMCRLLERSHPELRHYQDQIKTRLYCDECEKKHKTVNSVVLNKYDSIVQGFMDQ